MYHCIDCRLSENREHSRGVSQRCVHGFFGRLSIIFSYIQLRATYATYSASNATQYLVESDRVTDDIDVAMCGTLCAAFIWGYNSFGGLLVRKCSMIARCWA